MAAVGLRKVYYLVKQVRPFYSFLSACTPVIGAASTGYANFVGLVVILFVGWFGHVFAFTLNDLCDYKIDCKSKLKGVFPLHTGKLTLKDIKYAMVLSIILAYTLGLAFFGFNYYLIPMTLATVFIVLYNLTSKKFPGMDVFDMSAIAVTVLFGAMMVTNDVPRFTLYVALISFLLMGLINIFFGGIKDVENDRRMGGQTLSVLYGVKTKNGKYYLPTVFATIIVVMTAVLYFLMFLVALNFVDNFVFGLLSLICGSIAILSVYRLLFCGVYTDELSALCKRTFCMFGYLFLPVTIMSINLFVGVFIVALCVVWYGLHKLVFKT